MKEKKVKNKRVLCYFCFAVLVMCMTGCKRRPILPQQNVDNAKELKLTIGISFPTTELAYRKAMKQLVETTYSDKIKNDEIEIQIYDAEGSQEQQNKDILEMVELNIDGIIVIPNTIEGCIPAVEYANTKNIPVITVDNQIRSSFSSQEVSFVGADHYSMGRDAANLFLRILEETYPEKENWNVIQLTGIADSSGAIDRGRAIADTLALEERISLLGSYDGEFMEIYAKCVMKSCLQIYPEIDGVICQNDNMAEGCYQAIEEAGRSEEIMIVGIDGQKSTLELIKKGKIQGTVFQNPSMILKGIDYLCDYLNGDTLKKVYLEPTDMIDKTNVDDYLKSDLLW